MPMTRITMKLKGLDMLQGLGVASSPCKKTYLGLTASPLYLVKSKIQIICRERHMGVPAG